MRCFFRMKVTTNLPFFENKVKAKFEISAEIPWYSDNLRLLDTPSKFGYI